MAANHLNATTREALAADLDDVHNDLVMAAGRGHTMRRLFCNEAMRVTEIPRYASKEEMLSIAADIQERLLTLDYAFGHVLGDVERAAMCLTVEDEAQQAA